MSSIKTHPSNRMLLRHLNRVPDEEWLELCSIRGFTVRGYADGEGYVVYGPHAHMPVDSMDFEFFEIEAPFGYAVGPTYASVVSALKQNVMERITNSMTPWDY